MARNARFRTRLVPVAVMALSLAVFGPGLPTASAHPGHIEKITDAILADRQPAQLTTALGPQECVDGFAGPYPCENVDLLSAIPLTEMGGAMGNDVWGWTDPETGREYALMGMDTGTAFVDVTEPTAPVYVGLLPSHTPANIWRDVKVINDHAVVVADLSPGHGMQVFDLTRLRDPVTTPTVFTEDAHYDGFGSAHNVVVNEETGFAYAAGASLAGIITGESCDWGLHMVDMSDPKNPQFAGCFSDRQSAGGEDIQDRDGYVHDAQCVIYRGPDAEHSGREICFASNEDRLTIADVTDKKEPVVLGWTTYPGVGYTHQGWLSKDQGTFILGDELDEIDHGHGTRTRFFDVSDLENPTVDFVYTADNPAIDHNLFTVGNLVYMANYRSGLRILKAPKSEVGYFDIYPADDEPEFNGAWGNYPFFESGIVVVTGIEQGLFVLQPNLKGGGAKGGGKGPQGGGPPGRS